MGFAGQQFSEGGGSGEMIEAREDGGAVIPRRILLLQKCGAAIYSFISLQAALWRR